ncbi:MAG: glycosyltransferase 61 family protein [Eubacteriales bacterium]
MKKSRLLNILKGKEHDLIVIGLDYLYLFFNPSFDRKYYLSNNIDVTESKMDPLLHFVAFGFRESRNPNPEFDTNYYLTNNPDVLNSGLNPLVHYLKYGIKESRNPSPLADSKLYINQKRSSPTITANIEPINGNKDTNIQVVYDNNQLNWKMNFEMENIELTLIPPSEYIGILKNISLIGGTRLIISEKGVLLHDEMYQFDHSPMGDYDIKIWGGIKVIGEKCIEIFAVNPNEKRIIEEAILLSCDHDNNYFHWMVECLPKMLMIMEYKKFLGIPILLKENLHPNLMYALRILTGESYPIIEIEGGAIYNIKKLVYPSDLSRIMDKYTCDYIMGTDIVLSQKWIRKVRELLLSNGNSSNCTNIVKRKLYLCRHNAEYRKLLNEEEIEIGLLKLGYEIINTATCNFQFQQELFKQAEIVIGPTGAAITNMMLSPKDTKFIVLISDHKSTKFSLWEQLAEISGMQLKFCIGSRAFQREDFHDDYTIDLRKLLELINEI